MSCFYTFIRPLSGPLFACLSEVLKCPHHSWRCNVYLCSVSDVWYVYWFYVVDALGTLGCCCCCCCCWWRWWRWWCLFVIVVSAAEEWEDQRGEDQMSTHGGPCSSRPCWGDASSWRSCQGLFSPHHCIIIILHLSICSFHLYSDNLWQRSRLEVERWVFLLNLRGLIIPTDTWALYQLMLWNSGWWRRRRLTLNVVHWQLTMTAAPSSLWHSAPLLL